MRRTLGVCLLLALIARADDAAEEKKIEAVDDETVKEALAEFEQAFKTKEIEQKQDAVFSLADYPHDLTIKRLEKIMRHRSPAVRNVACLALGAQGHNPEEAGKILMRSYKKEYKNSEVISSIIEGMAELKYLKYWPQVKPALKDPRSAIVIRVLYLLGETKDYRAIPRLLELYHIAMPKRVKWKTGEVRVDTGTAGDADQKAAEAAFNKKYGRGGSKEKRKAAAKAKSFDERNFDQQLRRCVKAITGQDFDNAIDFEDWYIENYIEVWKKIAEMSGKDVAKAEAKARAELPELKRKIAEDRKKLEEKLKKEEEERKKAGK